MVWFISFFFSDFACGVCLFRMGGGELRKVWDKNGGSKEERVRKEEEERRMDFTHWWLWVTIFHGDEKGQQIYYI